ncbi:conjugal transfer protein TraI [Amycolatopsis sp. NPDC058340]|uniref:conjugal transfer protein TraI n=1 Tax=Amycolatopsis sp. NPDC058340 TaxID=3346453 RepID=UPI00364CEE95
MTTTNLDHSDGGDSGDPEFSAGLAALEKHLADVAAHPTDPPPPPDPPAQDEAPGTGPATPEVAGPVRRQVRTRRVQRRIAEHAEAHQLLTLEHDDAPFEVTSDKVRARRKAVVEAARLWKLDRDPRVLAYRDARMLTLITRLALVSLVLALAWSTAGVQAFAAEGAPKWSPSWWFAWLVEPFCSLALLMVVGGKAYLATRGHKVADKGLDRAEWVFLSLTLGMNAWPHLPGIADEFVVSALVLHILGPIVAMAVVRALPRLMAAFRELSIDLDDPEPGPAEPAAAPAPGTAAANPTASTATGSKEPAPARTAPARRTAPAKRSVRSTIPEPKRRDITALRAEFQQALESRPEGFDPANGAAIMRTLKCAKKYANQLRDEYLNRQSGGDA